MAGTKAGGKLAAKKNLERDPDFYAKIGAKGGRNGSTGGFAAGEEGRERARKFGAIGGRISRRTKKSKSDLENAA
jgi:general stress protein YciG